MIAYNDASAALEKRDAERCWYSLQGLIAAAMQMHQLLWPAPDSSLPWAVELRAELEVLDDSPLNQPHLRSAFDLAATLEAWSTLRPGQAPLLSNLSSGGLADTTLAECVRCFDPQTGAFTLFGNIVDLPPLLNAIARLGPKAEEELQRLREVV